MSRRQATLFSLIGGTTALSTMWESWRNARMAQSTPWRATLGMPVSSRAIQSGVALSTVTECRTISRAGQKETRGQSSGCSFALHKAVAVASRMDKSLSLNLSRSISKRFRMVLLSSAFSGNMYGSIGISNIVAIYAKSPRLGCFPSSSIAWRCRGEISSVSANFSRVIFWASRRVLMSSPIGVKSNPYLFFLFFSISIYPPPVLKFVMFHFTEIEVLIKRDRISMYRNYKCYIVEQEV